MVFDETKKLFLKMISEIGTGMAAHLVETAKNQNNEVVAAIPCKSKEGVAVQLQELMGNNHFSIEKVTEDVHGSEKQIALVKMHEKELHPVREKSLALFFAPLIKGIHLEINAHQGKYDLKLLHTKDKRIIKSLLRVIPAEKAEELVQLSGCLAQILDCPLIEKYKEKQ